LSWFWEVFGQEFHKDLTSKLSLEFLLLLAVLGAWKNPAQKLRKILPVYARGHRCMSVVQKQSKTGAE